MVQRGNIESEREMAEEPPIDPTMPVIDPHMHLWEILPSSAGLQEPQRYLLSEWVDLIAASGHNITHTVFVECHQMYRADGPRAMAPLGETEFANGIAAMSASGNYGPCRLAHRIVANADLSGGKAVLPLIEAHACAAGDRFRGIRMPLAYSKAGAFGVPGDARLRDLMTDAQFRQGASLLQDMKLSLDIWCFDSQLRDVAALADAMPHLPIVVDHLGTIDPARDGDPGETFRQWRDELTDLSRRPNIVLKLGGLGMDVTRPVGGPGGTAMSSELADRWRAFVETGIAAFSPDRCMFESNFPPDRAAGSYGATWNAFKRIVSGYSTDEKDQLFRGTAARIYDIDI